MGIAQLITATLVLSSIQPSQAGFGVPMVLGYHTVGVGLPTLVASYATLQEAETAGHVAGSAVHARLSSIFSQNPRPPVVKVGRRTNTFAQVLNFLPTDTTEGKVYAFVIRHAGVDYTASYTVLAASTPTIISTGLKTAIDLLAIPSLTTSIAVATLVCTGASGKFYSYLGLPSYLTVTDATAVNSLAADLAAVRAEDSDWYGLCCDAESKAAVQAVAAVVETYKAIYVYDTSDSACADAGSTTDVLFLVKASGYTQTFGTFRKNVGRGTSVALMAQRLTAEPGSDTWAYKTLRAVEADANLSTTEETAVRAKNGNTYTLQGGVSVTLLGKAASGEYMDIVRGLHWLHARIVEGVYGLLLSNPKIPYTDDGIAAIQGVIDAKLKIASGDRNKLVVPGSYVVNVPTAASVPTVDKTLRVLNGVSFSALLQGAVHAVAITGNLSL